MRKTSLKEKLIAVLMATTLVGVILSGIGFVGLSYLVQKRTIVDDVTELANVYGGNCRAALVFHITEDAESVLASLATRPSIQFAQLYTPAGEPFAAYLANTNQPPPKRAPATGYRYINGGLEVTCEIASNEDLPGKIAVFDDLRQLHEQVVMNIMVLLFTTCIALAIAYLLALHLRNIVARPVIALTEATENVAKKRDYAIRVERTSNDEVGTLVTSFNLMLEEIQRRTADVQEARKRAEQRAEEAERSRRLLEREMGERQRAEAHERELQERLARAKRMESLGVLAGGVAHDLNNILGPLVGLPELVQKEVTEAARGKDAALEKARGDLAVIQSAAQRASTVIRDLMTLSRRGNYKREPLDVGEMIRHWLATNEFASIKARFPELGITTDLPPDKLIVSGSESHLSRVIANLVGNAAEACPTGWLRLQMEEVELKESYAGTEMVEPGRYVLITVADNGTGMSPETLTRVFEPFFTTKQAGERSGSGLGLAIVHGIIKDHDGVVDVESEEGQGTTFRLYLPRISVTPPAMAGCENVQEGTENILVVDDEPAQRFLAKRALERLGYSTTTADSGHEAIDMFAHAKQAGEPAPFDLVVLDMIMEVSFDGLDTLREILKHYPEIKVIIASGYAASERGQAALEMGAHWLSKPYEYRELAQLVRRLLDGEDHPQTAP